MPELPDIETYLHALRPRMSGHILERVRLASPFLLRSVEPPLTETHGRVVEELRRLGKRLVLCLEGQRFLVLHLMIAGRLQWKKAGAKVPKKLGQAAFDLDSGTLLLTEAGSKRRASLSVVAGEEGLRTHDPGGLEVLGAGLPEFRAALTRDNHTVKRAMTDPRILSGIGNAYSDEILHRARMSPFKRTQKLSDAELAALLDATVAVHGKHRQPCPECGSKVQRIRYASNESNYCATCQTGASCWPTARWRGCSRRTGPRRWRSSRSGWGAPGQGGRLRVSRPAPPPRGRPAPRPAPRPRWRRR